MTFLVDGSPWVVLLSITTACALVAVCFRVLLRHHLGEDPGAAAPVAGPLMPALGAVFALLAATTIGAEAAQYRSAGDDVRAEAAAASRLAWASTSPGVDTEAIHVPLARYLQSTRVREWRSWSGAGSADTMQKLAVLERSVRAEASDKDLSSAQASELLTSLDSLTSLRRQRLASASNEMPQGYLLVVVVSGLALVANSAALAVAHRSRVALLTSGLVIVVAMALSLLIAISSPFAGGFVVDGQPIEQVRSDVVAGAFGS